MGRPRDPNKGSSFGWTMMIGLIVFALLLVFLAGPLCPRPEKWERHDDAPQHPNAAP